ncbi:MAG: OmpH family outer membrane protein [Gammaproteobacteria bacterium]|nr:OmpH family outer membrane protein [Gammaproteobacteria bacterium]
MRYGFIAAGLLATSLLASISTQAAEGPRIAVVNLQGVIGTSKAGQDANNQLQTIMQKLQGELKDKQSKMQVLKDQLDKADSKSSDYAKLQKNYQDSQNDVQQFVLMGRQDIEQRRQELLQPIEQELSKVIDEYGKAHHYDFILSQNSGAVFANPKYDVTKGVTAALDADWAKQQKAPKTPNAQNTQKPPAGDGE